MAKQRPRKVRVAFRKNREKRVRSQNLTHDALDQTSPESDGSTERITGKGRLTRYRTIVGVEESEDGVQREIDEQACQLGRVLRTIGSNRCDVQAEQGAMFSCSVRRVVRTMLRQSRNAVVAGDRVMFCEIGASEGVIERVEPRRTTFSRCSGRYEHVIASNIDQLLIVSSAASPPLKPALIDRFLVSAAKGDVRPIICINKVDLVEPDEVQPIVEMYRGLGYDVELTSATAGTGIDRLRSALSGRETVVGGQSGVGKSSLLNAVQPGLGLRTNHVSPDSGKGRHTTRVTELLPLTRGGWIVDTPGVRQMDLWDVSQGEIEAYFIEFVPFIADCRFPDCTHTHETGCRVKAAVAEGEISTLRYESYLRMFLDDE